MIVLAAGAAATAFFLTRTAKKVLVRRLNDRFSTQLMESLESVIQALRSGASFLQALTYAAAQCQAPLGPELKILLEEVRLGLRLDEALERFAKRNDGEITQSLVAAVRISQFSGGSLAGVLTNLTRDLRTQLQFRRRIEALAAQGRLQAWILLALPVLLSLLLWHFEPTLVRDFWNSPYGEPATGAIFFAESLAVLLMQKIIEVKL